MMTIDGSAGLLMPDVTALTISGLQCLPLGNESSGLPTESVLHRGKDNGHGADLNWCCRSPGVVNDDLLEKKKQGSTG